MNELYPYNLLAAIFEDKPEEMPKELTADHRAGLEYALFTLESRDAVPSLLRQEVNVEKSYNSPTCIMR